MLPRIPRLDHCLFRFVCRLVPRIPWLDAPGRLVPRIPWLDTTTVVTWDCPTYPVAGLFPHHTLGCLVPRIPWLDEAVAAWDCPTHPVAGLLSSRVLSLLCTPLLPCLPPARNCQVAMDVDVNVVGAPTSDLFSASPKPGPHVPASMDRGLEPVAAALPPRRQLHAPGVLELPRGATVAAGLAESPIVVVVLPMLPNDTLALPTPPQAIGTEPSYVYGVTCSDAKSSRKAAVTMAAELGKQLFTTGATSTALLVGELQADALNLGYGVLRLVVVTGPAPADGACFYDMTSTAGTHVYGLAALCISMLSTLRQRALKLKPVADNVDSTRADARSAAGSTWEEVVARDRAINSQLRKAMLAVGPDDPHHEFFQDTAERVGALDLPSIESVTALLTATAPGVPTDVMDKPFAERYLPPHTRECEYLPTQPKTWPKGFKPRHWQDLYYDWAVKRILTWFADELYNLRLIFELGEAAKGKLRRHEVLVLGPEARPPPARGIVADLRIHKPGDIVPILDFDGPVSCDLDSTFFDRMLPGWPDQRTASMVRRGVNFGADDLIISDQTVLCPHLASLRIAPEKVEKELMRLESIQYLVCCRGPGTVPFFQKPKGIAIRKLEPDRPRGVEDGNAPRSDGEGPHAESLNASIGLREQLPTRAEGNPPLDESLTPANDKEEDELIIVNGYQARSIGERKWAKQHMPSARDKLMDIAILQHASELGLGGPLVSYLDDFKDAFMQNGLHPSQLPHCAVLWRSVDESRFSSEEPMFMMGTRLGYGNAMASLHMQLVDAGLVHIIRQRIDERSQYYFDKQLEELDADDPRVQWIHRRRELSKVTGRNECRLYSLDIYTDDLFLIVCGFELLILSMRCAREVFDEFNLKMAIMAKRQAGTNVVWSGLDFHLTPKILSVPPEKRMRMLPVLRRVVARDKSVTFDEFRSCTGRLEHILPYTAVGREHFYHMYSEIFAHGIRHGPGSPLLITTELCEQCERWIERLLTSAGCWAAEAFDRFDDEPLMLSSSIVPNLHIFSSDAATEDARVPGLGGYMHGYWFEYALTEKDLAAFHITALEFSAVCLAVVIFCPLLEGLPAIGRIDAKVVSYIMQRSSASSTIMQFIHSWLLGRPEMELPSQLEFEHCFGESNVAADAASRGEHETLEQLAAHLRVRLRRIDVEVLARELLDAMHDFLQRRAVERSDPLVPNTGKAFSSDYTGDGPSEPWHLPPLPAIALPSFKFRESSYLPPLPALTASQTPIKVAPPIQTFSVLPRPYAPRLVQAWVPLSPSPIVTLVGRRVAMGPLRLGQGQVKPPPPPLPPLAPSSTISGSKRGRDSVDWADLEPRRRGRPPESYRSLWEHGCSRYALRPRDPEVAAELECILEEAADAGVPPGTLTKEKKSWSLWTRFCQEVWDTDPVRLNRHAHAGIDVAGQQDEEKLLSSFLPWLVGKVSPRSKKDKAAKPKSLYAHVLSVRAIHRRRFRVEMVRPLGMKQVLKAIIIKFVRDNGPEALIPKRKEPATAKLLADLLGVPGGTALGQTSLDWGSTLGVSLSAMLCTAFSGGFRKSELALPAGQEFDKMRVSRASLKWRIGGIFLAAPTAAQLNSLVVGDFAILTPPPSKSDPFGVFFGGRPIYLPYVADSAINAAAALARLELALPVAAGARRTTPLFVMNDSMKPMSASRADDLLAALLRVVLPPNRRSHYSWHSFRIGLACALLAQNAEPERIQAMCRWKSKESLAIYARLNPETYGEWILKAQAADVSSISTTNLPQFDDDVCAAVLTQLADWEGNTD